MFTGLIVCHLYSDTFRKFSHHVFDETQSFDPKKVNNNEIIFINSDLIEIFFKLRSKNSK